MAPDIERRAIAVAPYMKHLAPPMVDAYVCGDLAAHKAVDKRKKWTITHIPSGSSLRTAFLDEWEPLTCAAAKAILVDANARFPEELAAMASIPFGADTIPPEARKALVTMAEAKVKRALA
jgi:hypothetical protein